MTQEERDLLLRDLSARLPYGAMITDGEKTRLLEYIVMVDVAVEKGYRPYLRPMSSMTEEELQKMREYSGLIYEQLDLSSYQDDVYKCLDFYLSEIPSYVVILVFDWLNAHHFNYRGLIPMGLALEAPEDMYDR